jgi:glycosyltransferase involved in cell wall biosynthesis
VAITVTDFFADIYLKRSAALRWLADLIRRTDIGAWQKLPLIFTRAGSTKGYLVERGVSAERILPVYDPCDFSVYRPLDRQRAREKLGFTPDHMVVAHHGILHPNKGNDRVITALADLIRERPNLRYLLIGDGADMSRLRRLVADLNLTQSVVFTGWLPSIEQVNEALNAADIGLVMRTELDTNHFAITGALVHSMACGLPVLAANLKGVAEIVHEDDAGLLFDPADMAEFKRKLIVMAGDKALRERCGRRALSLAHELFDMQKVTDATVNPLLRLIAEPSGK